MFTFKRSDVFSTDGWIPVNKMLAHQAGIEAAIIYGELTRKEDWYRKNNKLKDGEWFFVTHDDLQESTTLKRTAQDKGIKSLIDLGLIEKKNMGLPAKRYFRIIDENIQMESTTKIVEKQQPNNNSNLEDQKSENPCYKQVVEIQQPSLLKSNNIECRNSAGNNNKINNKKINNNNLKDLSIIEQEIQLLDLPTLIQKKLIINKKRLIEESIDIDIIVSFYHSYKEFCNVHQIATILENVLRSTKGKIRNISNLLHIAMQNFIENFENKSLPEEEKINIIPKWMRM